MIIKGVKNWSVDSIRYDQTKNATEAIIKKLNAENKLDVGFLEACGMGAFFCTMEGLGYLTPEMYPTLNGESIQMDDWGMMFANNPMDLRITNYPMPNNRYAETYIKMANILFKCKAKYLQTISFDLIAVEVSRGNGIMICLNDPAHWLSIIAYNETDDSLLYNDTWGSRKGNTNNGVREKLRRFSFFNVKDFMLIFDKKADE
jgi:hypothetical protein